MSYWGKLLGGMAGFMVGGPMGAVVGAALGHAADSGGIGGGINMPFAPTHAAALQGGRDQVFAIAVTVLTAKLAKSDGAVSRVEIDAFKRHFRIPPGSVRDIGRLFDQARDSAEGYEPYARRLGELFADQPAMLEDVMAALFAVARADGPLRASELSYLLGVHRCMGLGRAAWDRLRDGTPRGDATADPYAALGLTAAASDAELRATWRRLMRQYHPDSLAGREQSDGFARMAADKVARINAAWDRIKRERRL